MDIANLIRGVIRSLIESGGGGRGGGGSYHIYQWKF